MDLLAPQDRTVKAEVPFSFQVSPPPAVRFFISFTFFFATDDDDREYKTLVQRVSQQVFRINGNITSIERLVNFLGGPRDTADVRNKL